MNNFEQAMESIGQAVFEKFDVNTPKPVKNLLTNISEAYVLVFWPESQDLMEEDWFEDEAILDINNEIGSSYFIPIKRII